MAKRKIAGTVADPTLPKTPIEIDGKTYDLCFTFGALARAKQALRARGIEMNLLQSLDFTTLDADNLPILFYAALLPFHEEIGYDDAIAMVTMPTYGGIYVAICTAYSRSVSKQDPEAKANPPQEPGK
jgi:hypothetical protein